MALADSTFTGSLRTSATGDELVAVQLRVDLQGIWVEGADGVLGLPFSRLVVERADDGRLRFTDPEEPDVEVFTSENRILLQQPFRQRAELRRQVRQMEGRRQGRLRLRLAAGFLGVFAAALLVLGFGARLLVHVVVARVPPAWEADLGNKLFREMTGEVEVVEAPASLAYLDAVAGVVRRGLPRQPYSFVFSVVRSAQPNAFALPGGRVLVTTGLLEKAGGSEEVAGVLAHEMAHVVHRHGLRKLVATTGPLLVLSEMSNSRESFLTSMGVGSLFILNQQTSREYEAEADRSGWDYLVAARLDPRGELRFLERLGEDPLYRVIETAVPEVLRSHPPDAARIANLRKRWDQCNVRSGFASLPPLPRIAGE